jgi:hypothetical protein
MPREVFKKHIWKILIKWYFRSFRLCSSFVIKNLICFFYIYLLRGSKEFNQASFSHKFELTLFQHKYYRRKRFPLSRANRKKFLFGRNKYLLKNCSTFNPFSILHYTQRPDRKQKENTPRLCKKATLSKDQNELLLSKKKQTEENILR